MCSTRSVFMQVTVSRCLLSCGDLFLPDCHHPKSQALLKEFRQTAEELTVMNNINAVWCGDDMYSCEDAADTRRCRTAGSEDCGTGSVRSAGGSCSSSSTVSYSASRLINPASKGQDSDLQWFVRQSRVLLTYRSDTASADDICAATHASASRKSKISSAMLSTEALLEDCEEFESLADALLSPPQTPPPSSPSPPTSSSRAAMILTSSLKAWVSLLASKSILIRFGDHQRAYRWVRKALSYVSPKGWNQQRQRGLGGEGASCLALDKCLPRLEVRAFMRVRQR